MLIDTLDRLVRTNLIPAQVVTANAQSAALDLAPYVGLVSIEVSVGAASAGTNPTFNLAVYSGPDTTFGDATALPGASIAQVTAANSLQIIGVDTRLAQRYLFVAMTIGGTVNPAFPVAVIALAEKKYQP